MRISVIQMTPTPDLQRNVDQARALLTACIREDRPDMVCLPECWTCIGADAATTRASAEALPTPGSGGRGGTAYEFLRGIAREHGIAVHGGSIGELDDGRLFNTTVAFDREGRETARYRKIHMADFTGPDGTRYGESDLYGAGDRTVVFDAGELKAGCAICYDLRFPELFHALRRDGAELIVLPAVFTLHTGKDHWETLLRARATRSSATRGATSSPRPRTAPAGPPRASTGSSPPRCGARSPSCSTAS
jgi:predicted amidohydrolase